VDEEGVRVAEGEGVLLGLGVHDGTLSQSTSPAGQISLTLAKHMSSKALGCWQGPLVPPPHVSVHTQPV
jgi:hypothetical protein